ncbi:MAG: RHS repeat-associated core domain-containing protein [Clostridia bacterium]|nr:RHS repeat-associated core domain-containing protein [Clostridia bacterium]
MYEARKTRRQEHAQQGAVGILAVGEPDIPPGGAVSLSPDPEPGDPPPPPPAPAPEYDITVTCYLVLNGKYLAKMVQENSDPAQTYFLHTDMVGSTRAITDSAGQVVARFEYEPFGLLTMSTGPMASGAHRFTGKPEDGATGLYYFGARHYDPEIGRFISRDPATDGPNLYGYCRSNPLRYMDPTGTWAIGVGLGGSAALALRLSCQVLLVFDGAGNTGVLIAGAGGGGTPTVGVVGQFLFTSAETIFDMRNSAASVGGSAYVVPGVSVGVDVVLTDSWKGVSIGVGPIATLWAEGHGEYSSSLVWGGKLFKSLAERVKQLVKRAYWQLPVDVRKMIIRELNLSADDRLEMFGPPPRQAGARGCYDLPY